MQILDEYFELQKRIYQYFGYVENWRVIPLEDSRGYHWIMLRDKVFFSEDDLTPEVIRSGDTLYSNFIYNQRFLPQAVYRGQDYTLVCVDTRTDGNKFLQIFENAKEVIDPSPEQSEALGYWDLGELP